MLGLPTTIWTQLVVPVEHSVGAYGLVSVQHVIAPASALVDATGKRYPPRLDLMRAALQGADWSLTAMLPPDQIVVVSSLLPTTPLFSVAATANGAEQRSVAMFANTAIFRCHACAANQVRWQINIRGGLPETVSISSVAASGPSATISR